MENWPTCYFDSKGLLSVKSAYKLVVAKRDALAPMDACTSGSVSNREGEFQWHKIWQLKVPNKVQMFVWRLTQNSLLEELKLTPYAQFSIDWMKIAFIFFSNVNM